MCIVADGEMFEHKKKVFGDKVFFSLCITFHDYVKSQKWSEALVTESLSYLF